jgi:uncharacterized protein YfaA (DUF2138 family)
MTRRLAVAAVATAVALAATLALHRSVGRAHFSDAVQPVRLDLGRPDALVRTRSLSQLPRDLLKVPLARDLFTEDLIFYYEEHPDRLGLSGALRRIAYEHDLRWTDEVLAWVLDRPAEIALWRAGDGRLRYWVAALTRPELAALLQEAAKVALEDRQLTRAGTIATDGGPVELLALEYSPARTLIVAGAGERVVILSHPGLLLGEDRTPLPDREALVGRLLSADEGRRSPYREAFRLGAELPEHSLVVRAHYLSFGYQRFFPGFDALRFDFGAGGWSTHVLVDGASLPPATLRDRELWAGVPANPAACALLPADWAAGQALLERVPARDGRKASSILAELEGPAAACWYPESRLQAPLFAATLKSPRADLAPLLEALFDWGLAKRAGGEALRARRPAEAGTVWQRTVQVPFATLNDEGSPEPGPLTVTLALEGRHLFFSPDAKRVEQALLTLAKRYPSVADVLPAEAVTLGIVSPQALARLGKDEALVMLPRGAEPIFRSAAERLLLPRLEAVGQYPPYRLALAVGDAPPEGWQAVTWQELSR